MLGSLSASSLRAAFFVIAQRATAHPQVIAAIRAAGHAVELHCDEHVRHTDADRATIEGGHPPRDGRAGAPRDPPAPLAHAVGRAGVVDRGISPSSTKLELCGWDVDSHDWRGYGAEHMLATIGPELRQGSVVLLHDGLGPGATRQGCEETVRFTRMIAAESVAT